MASIIAILILSVAGLAGILMRVFAALALNCDCRARNLKATTLYTVLAVFFPVITVVIYLCIRSGAEPNEKECTNCHLRFDGAAAVCPNCQCPAFTVPTVPQAQELQRKAKNYLITAIVFCALPMILAPVTASFGVYDSLKDDGNTISISDYDKDGDGEAEDFDVDLDSLQYYDREGKAYDNPEDVPFYSADGTVYNFITDLENSRMYFVNADSKEELPAEHCYVDKDGYFVYDRNGAFEKGDAFNEAKDKDGNTYYLASLVIWNKDGDLIGGPSDLKE